MHDLFYTYLFFDDVPMRNESELFCIWISLFIYFKLCFLFLLFFFYSFAIILLILFIRKISYMNSPCQSYFTPIHLHNLILRHFKHQRFSFIYFLTIFRFCALSGCCDGKYLLGCSANVNHSS